MIYLILTILCSASLTLALRISREYSSNRYGILLGNYLTCTVIAFFMLPEKNLLPPESALAVGTGCLNGAIFLTSLMFTQLSIEKNGSVLTSAFSRMGIMLPVLASILFLGEHPTLLQTAGMLIVVTAIIVINMEKNIEYRHGSWGILLGLFLAGGVSDGMAKVFEHIGERRFDALFLFYTFFMAAVLTFFLMVRAIRKGKETYSAVDLISGICVGIPNYFHSALLLAAVTCLPAYIVYPCFSVGTILVVTIVSVLVLKDRLTKQQTAGCGLILVALTLLNL